MRRLTTALCGTLLSETPTRAIEIDSWSPHSLLSADSINAVATNPTVVAFEYRVDSANDLSNQQHATCSIGNATNLQSLRLSVPCKFDIDCLSRLKNLEVLELRSCDLSRDRIESFSKLTSLKQLILESTTFDDTMIDHIAKLKSLELLNVNNTLITHEGVERIDAFTWIENRNTFDLSDLATGEADVLLNDGRVLDTTVPMPAIGPTPCEDGTYIVRPWLLNYKDPTKKRRLSFFNRRDVETVGLSRDGEYVAVQRGQPNAVVIYELATEQEVFRIPSAKLPKHFDVLFCGGTLVVHTTRSEVWDVINKQKLPFSIPLNVVTPRIVDLSDDGTLALVKSKTRWSVHDVSTAQVIDSALTDASWGAFNGANEVITVSDHSEFEIENLTTHQKIRISKRWLKETITSKGSKSKKSRSAYGIAISPSAKRLLIYDLLRDHKRKGIIYDLETGKALHRIENRKGATFRFTHGDNVLFGSHTK